MRQISMIHWKKEMIGYTLARSFKDKRDDYRIFVQSCLVTHDMAQVLMQARAESEDSALSDIGFREILLHPAE